MGLFSKKEDKIYSLEEALKLLKMSKYEKYTTVPVGDGFKIVPEEKVVINVEETVIRNQNRRKSFENQLSGTGEYKNLNTVVTNYNDYQSARRYQNQSYRNLGR